MRKWVKQSVYLHFIELLERYSNAFKKNEYDRPEERKEREKKINKSVVVIVFVVVNVISYIGDCALSDAIQTAINVLKKKQNEDDERIHRKTADLANWMKLEWPHLNLYKILICNICLFGVFYSCIREKERRTQRHTAKTEKQINENGSLIWNWLRCDAVRGSIVAVTFTRLGLINFCHPKGDMFNCCAAVSDALGSDIGCFDVFSNFRRVIIANGVWTRLSQAYITPKFYATPSQVHWLTGKPLGSVCEIVSFMRSSILVGQFVEFHIFFAIKYRRALKMKTFAIRFRTPFFFYFSFRFLGCFKAD